MRCKGRFFVQDVFSEKLYSGPINAWVVVPRTRRETITDTGAVPFVPRSTSNRDPVDGLQALVDHALDRLGVQRLGPLVVVGHGFDAGFQFVRKCPRLSQVT